ncbi:hypothetical protein POM88_001120 [Heracleum sosnowskyi]|uniref:Uncharacterized protein n=1 Tax=Heracleum sosnowskyi TaxID=360622 RepID=A0AAD8JFI8_9APIA|nr:hypothetical protein POM88_001120 [Heracleum sosnowskyi]
MLPCVELTLGNYGAMEKPMGQTLQLCLLSIVWTLGGTSQLGLIRNEPFDPKMIIPGDQIEDFLEIQLSTATKVFTKGIQKIKSKVVVDFVEAIIGVFLCCGGEVAA